MDRTTFLRSLIPEAGLSLEIGPSYNPLLPKREGFKVRTLDYLDAVGLRAKYQTLPVDVSAIEDVDYVVENGSMLATIGEAGIFSSIVASHVIEHTPDLIRFLNDCETLLAPGGVLLLAVPDQRRCFDVLCPPSSLGMVVQAHLDRRVRPSVGSLLDHHAYFALRDGETFWPADSAAPLAFQHDFASVIERHPRDIVDPGYTDVHVWRFVPSSFRLIVKDLHALGYTRLREAAFHATPHHEFYVVLSRNGEGPGLDRITLAQAAISEHEEIRVGSKGASALAPQPATEVGPPPSAPRAFPAALPPAILPPSRPLWRRATGRLRRAGRVLLTGMP